MSAAHQGAACKSVKQKFNFCFVKLKSNFLCRDVGNCIYDIFPHADKFAVAKFVTYIVMNFCAAQNGTWRFYRV